MMSLGHGRCRAKFKVFTKMAKSAPWASHIHSQCGGALLRTPLESGERHALGLAGSSDRGNVIPWPFVSSFFRGGNVSNNRAKRAMILGYCWLFCSSEA